MDRLCGAAHLRCFSASAAAAAATPGRNALNSPSSKKKAPPTEKMGRGNVYTNERPGAAEAPKCKRLQARSRQRARQGAYYSPKEVPFPLLARTNANKRQLQSTDSRERQGGSGRRRFFRGCGTFMAMLIKCSWEREPPTLLAAHTPKTA